MKKRFRYLVIIAILAVIFFEGIAFAGSTDIDKLKSYDFDSNSEIQKSPSIAKSVLTFFTYLSLFIIVALLTYFTTKSIAKARLNTRVKSKYMELVDSLPLGNDRGIYIIRAPQGLLMLGISPQGIYLLEKLDADEAELIYEAEANSPYLNKSFAGHLDEFLNNIKRSSTQNKNGDLK